MNSSIARALNPATRVVVMGLGHVGLPLTDLAAAAGHELVGLDVDELALAWADALLLSTLHAEMPLERLCQYEGPVFDACGELRGRVPHRRRL